MRIISIMLLSGLAACASSPEAKRADTSARVIAADVMRDSENPEVKIISWSTMPAGSPVTIKKQEGSLSAASTIIVEDVTDTQLLASTNKDKRVFFTIQPDGQPATVTALRVLPLEGGRNFRDMGGYKTVDGRTTKWGRVYRSGVMNKLTANDYSLLADLEIGTVLDFRSNEERAAEPTLWQGEQPEFISWDYTSAEGAYGLRQLFQSPDTTPAKVAQIMEDGYRRSIYEHAPKYKVMFERLIESDDPLAFHCSAGKDRTGKGAMLLLAALGVPKETIIADYAMSEKVVDFEAAFVGDASVDRDSPYAFLSELPVEVIRPLLRSNPAYIEAAMDQLEKDHGSVLAYIQNELGVDDDELTQLRDSLLTE